jgi:hypothetical protein
MPGNIFKNTCKSLDIRINSKKFKNSETAQAFLDEKISKGIPVGCQVGVFHLKYFPVEYRFHFNAHNIIIYGKDNDRYLISDPVMEHTTSLSSKELERVRFAKGIFAPKGHIYYTEKVGNTDPEILKRAIIKGIKRNTRNMLYVPGNIAGVKGIRFTSNQIRKLLLKNDLRNAGIYLAQIVRMQEEIGTGGGGFRFIYAAFLEKAADYLKEDKLIAVSEDFTKAGDLWRSSAVQMAGIYKGRLTQQKDFDEIADMLLEISEKEKSAFKKLSKLSFNK